MLTILIKNELFIFCDKGFFKQKRNGGTLFQSRQINFEW